MFETLYLSVFKKDLYNYNLNQFPTPNRNQILTTRYDKVRWYYLEIHNYKNMKNRSDG